MNRLIDAALSKKRAMREGDAPYPDDDAMVVTRFEGARLMELDPSVHHATARPQRLLKNDGTIVTQIVESVRRPAMGYHRRNASFAGGARVMTVKSFLSAKRDARVHAVHGMRERAGSVREQPRESVRLHREMDSRAVLIPMTRAAPGAIDRGAGPSLYMVGFGLDAASSSFWCLMQYGAHGTASSRLGSIGPPSIRHRPYVPLSIRRSAACTCCRIVVSSSASVKSSLSDSSATLASPISAAVSIICPRPASTSRLM